MPSRHAEAKSRILTTHTGSLPRPDDLSELLFNKMTGKEWGSQAFGGILAFAFGTIVAVFWQIAQGRAVTVDTNF